ncbi:MAG TPA: O-methyltransferase, partial [Cryptosporangiaceae bacterium]|nr:O-methyltransferase [Cryptosporangiaceae bacterium]
MGLSEELHEYLVGHGTPMDDVQRDLIAETAALGDIAWMQIAPEQAAFTTILTRLLGVRFAVEVGTFTGFSALAIARGLAGGGRLLCCDLSEEWPSIARRYWDRAGVADRIDLRIAPAIQTLRGLPAEPHVDLVFVDADKTGYPDYWEELVPRMRPGGVLLVDNVLAGGRVLDAGSDDENVRAIRRFNQRAAADERVEVVLLPIADGLTFARKR